MYFCKVVIADDLEGKNEAQLELLVLGMTTLYCQWKFRDIRTQSGIMVDWEFSFNVWFHNKLSKVLFRIRSQSAVLE